MKSIKESLSLLFAQKKESIERHKKRKLQEEINFIVASRKELFSLKSDLKENISKLSSRLKIANQETRSVQEQINNVLKN
ncbi:MAG TPA: hypothetical protein ENK88_07420 [Campylobacterales bacterium]|nr:hypothetical protein [Campylobacterales bacterium]